MVGNVILKVGSSESVLQLAVPGAELIDLDGKVLLPGFNDAHVHPFDSFTFPQFGTGAVVVNDNRFVPGPGPSFQDVLTAVQAAARVNPPGTWLMAFIGTQVLDDSSVDRLAIDAVAPDHPVLLSAWFGHGTFINTKAIQTLGLSLAEPDPLGGFFGRSPAGELDGEVREYAEHHIRRFFANQMTDEQLVNAYEHFARQAAQAGYTTIQEFAVGIPQSRHLRILRQANMPIRVRAHCFPLALDEPCDVPLDFSPERPFAMKYRGETSGLTTARRSSDSACCATTTKTIPETQGERTSPPPPCRRNSIARRKDAWRNAIRSSSIRPATGLRTRSLMRSSAPTTARRSGRCGARDWSMARFCSPLRSSARRNGDGRSSPIRPCTPWQRSFTPGFGPDQEAAVWPTRSLLEGDVRLAIGSDAAGTVRGPFVDLFFAQINPSNPAAAISLAGAITAYTKGSAYAEFKENVKGSLTPLSAADLVVVDRDIFNLERPEDILATQVLLTMVNGNIVHEVPKALRRK